jgi:dTDP-4-amino-4,6-dideoxygalactose transaminase
MKAPYRSALGLAEALSMVRCLIYYRRRGLDPGYDGHFEEQYCTEFSAYMGGGFSDAVSSGCAALYVALKSLRLPPRSLIATTPVTDASIIGCIVEQGHVPYLIDSMPNSYNSSRAELEARYRPDLRALIVTHAGGEPAPIEGIALFCSRNNIELIEDCSQAIGATPMGATMKVGNYGRFGCFSTMYRKNLSASGSSGLVFSRNVDDFRVAKQHADRGKKWWDKDLVDMRDPGFAEFPGLNWNSDELRCSIGLANLRRLDDTNERRRRFLRVFIDQLREQDVRMFTPYNFHEGFAPFFFPIFVDSRQSKKSVFEISNDLRDSGLAIGVKYGCLVSTWNWAKPYMADSFTAPNALSTRDNCFHLYLNERYSSKHAKAIAFALKKFQDGESSP